MGHAGFWSGFGRSASTSLSLRNAISKLRAPGDERFLWRPRSCGQIHRFPETEPCRVPWVKALRSSRRRLSKPTDRSRGPYRGRSLVGNQQERGMMSEPKRITSMPALRAAPKANRQAERHSKSTCDPNCIGHD